MTYIVARQVTQAEANNKVEDVIDQAVKAGIAYATQHGLTGGQDPLTVIKNDCPDVMFS
jgi:hypothetical protein